MTLVPVFKVMKEAGIDPVKVIPPPRGAIIGGRVQVIGLFTDDIWLLRSGEKQG